MNPDTLKQTLTDHSLWIRNQGGARADLRSAVLSGAVLSGADLRNANIYGADLRNANLRSAVLSGANLRSADLRSADLSGADLFGADLRSAVLYGADLSSANLSSAVLYGADLSSANLSESQGVRYAQVSWSGHGERGRQLLAVELPDGLRLFCGCFQGTADELRTYIANGAEEHRNSRTKALDFILSCFP